MRRRSRSARCVLGQVIERLETRRMLCEGTNPPGYVPSRLTPGHDHFAEGGLLQAQTSGRAGGDAVTNLAVTDVYMSDADGNEIATPAIGSYAYMVAHFTTSGIPAATTYTVRMSVGGVNIDYPINWGSGAVGTGSYVIQLGVWLVSAGFKNASVTLDVNNDVAETTSADNSASTNFSPASPSTKFVMPLEGTPWIDWTSVNYVDLDLSGNQLDYNGGTWVYDGHNGWDLTTANWRLPDAGLSVFAAAGGTVVDAADGNFDRINTWTNPPSANFVTIDHGNGFTTTYYHLRKYSVTVNIGDTVTAGEQIGLAGSSGRSTNPHLHFGVYYHGMLVEPNVSPSSYFSAGNTLGYAGDHPTVLDAGIIDVSPTSQEWYEGPPTINTFNPGDTIRSWALFGGAQTNDDISAAWYLPNGLSAGTSTWNLPNAEYQYSTWNASYSLPANAALGTWQLAWLLNGVEFKRLDIGVRSTALPAEVQLTDTAGNYIKDGRTTPFDLGTLWEDTPNALPTFSFRVRNRGGTALTTDSLAVPSGFTVTDGLAASIAAGSFDTVTLRLDDQTAGHKIGWVGFNSSDGDSGEGYVQFRVEGTVLGVTPMALDENPDSVYIKRNGGNTQVWINRSTALSPTSEFLVSETAGWTINTGSGNDTVTVDFSAGNPLQDTLDLDLGFDTDTLRVIGTTADDTILIGSAGLGVASRSILYTGLNALSVDGSSGDDLVSLNFFSLNDDLDLITFPVTVTGGSGIDSVIANDSSDTLARTFDLDEDHLSRGGSFGGLTYAATTEMVRVNTNGLASVFNLNPAVATAVDFEINAGGGNDTINVGVGDVGQLDGTVTFDGQAGTDAIFVDDTGIGNLNTWTITQSQVDRLGFGGLDYANAEGLIVSTSNGPQTVNVESTAQLASLDLRTNGGTDVINVNATYFGTEMTVNGGAGADDLTINGDAVGFANVRLLAAEDLGTLTIAAGGKLTISPSLVEANPLRVNALAITGSGVIDLLNNPMILDYSGASPEAAIRALVQSGYHNGAWDGAGIRSSTVASNPGRALGYSEASAKFGVFPASFAGQSVDNTSILFRYTQIGDTDLDRDVDFDDLLRVSQSYNSLAEKNWSQGDFTYDNHVTFDDLLGLAQRYGMPMLNSASNTLITVGSSKRKSGSSELVS